MPIVIEGRSVSQLQSLFGLHPVPDQPCAPRRKLNSFDTDSGVCMDTDNCGNDRIRHRLAAYAHQTGNSQQK